MHPTDEIKAEIHRLLRSIRVEEVQRGMDMNVHYRRRIRRRNAREDSARGRRRAESTDIDFVSR